MKNLVSILFINIFLTVTFLYASTPDAIQENKKWKAGVAKTNITPEEPMWMLGYAARNRPSEGILHDIWAKALVFEDQNGGQSVLITADVSGIGKHMSDRIRDRIGDKFGFTRAEIILNSSHTHTGPVLVKGPIDDIQPTGDNQVVGIYSLNFEQFKAVRDYSAKFEDQIVTLVGNAIDSMEPVELYSGNGVTRFQVNRRNNNESTLHKQTELNGPNDYAVPVIKVADETGDLIAIAFGYACHPTVLSDYKWSGDYAGFAQIELEKAYPGVTALFFQGAGADLNPLPHRTEPLAKQYGHELAGAVQRVLYEEMRPLSSKLSTAYSEIELQLADLPPTEKELIKIMGETSEYPNYLKLKAGVLLNQLKHGEPLMTYPYPVQVWQLGDQTILSLGGELVIDYAIEFKRIFGQDIFVLEYSNDVMSYVPSARIISEGGYEGSRSPSFTTAWHPNIHNKILRQTKILVE